MSFIEIKVRHWIKSTSGRRRVVERKKNFKASIIVKKANTKQCSGSGSESGSTGSTYFWTSRILLSKQK
jgi:hypothetical protein